jgi:hypothetical protein
MAWVWGVGIAAATCAGIVAGTAALRWLRRVRIRQAHRLFRLQREMLEAKFLDLARQTGKPEGLYWSDIDWDDDVKFVRDRDTGEQAALVGITVYFEREGSGPGEQEFDPPPHDATAVFHFAGGRWTTLGRALLNLDPEAALARFRDKYEPISSNDR